MIRSERLPELDSWLRTQRRMTAPWLGRCVRLRGAARRAARAPPRTARALRASLPRATIRPACRCSRRRPPMARPCCICAAARATRSSGCTNSRSRRAASASSSRPKTARAARAENLSAEEKARRERQRISRARLRDFELSKDGTPRARLAGRRAVRRRARERRTSSRLPGAVGSRRSSRPTARASLRCATASCTSIDIAARKSTAAHARRQPDAHARRSRVRRAGGNGPLATASGGRRIRSFLAYEEADLSPRRAALRGGPAAPGNAARGVPLSARGHGERERAARRRARSRAARRCGCRGTRAAYPYLVRVTWRDGPADARRRESRAHRGEDPRGRRAHRRARASCGPSATTRWLETPQADFPRWLADGSGFLWASERSGQWQLERRAADGKLVNARDAGGLSLRPAARRATCARADRRRARRHRPAVARHLARAARGRRPRCRWPTTPGLHARELRRAARDLRARATISRTARRHRSCATRAARWSRELPSAAEKPPFVPRRRIPDRRRARIRRARRAPARFRSRRAAIP